MIATFKSFAAKNLMFELLRCHTIFIELKQSGVDPTPKGSLTLESILLLGLDIIDILFKT